MLRAPLGWIRQAQAGSVVAYTLAFLVFGFICLYHISSAPSGLNTAEAAARSGSQSLSLIAHNPINGPHKLVVLAADKLGFGGHGALRLSSVVFAAIFALSFYLLARGWFGRSVGLLSTVIFIGTPIFIVTARQASAEVMLFSPVLLMAVYSWLLRTQKYRKEAWFCLVIAASLLVYIPGLIWWLAGAAVISRAKLKIVIARLSRQTAGLSLALALLLIAPLGIAVARNWHLLHGLLLIPAHWPHPLSLLKNFVWMLSTLFVKAPFHVDLIVGRLPLLDIIQVALLVFGVYAMWTAAKNKAWVLIAAINDQLSLLILCLPAAAIFMAAGLRYLYIEWRSIFPSNPIAKSLALVLMTVLVLAHLVFGLGYSLVAWPHSLATRDSYVIK
jgi:4-amino-4-deoxy-L-arabinose transferase-like glycosyltransferase